MRSFIVMQGETYEEDKDLGVIWSPIYDKAGLEPHFWARMKQVKKGDILFHYVKGSIVAISVAQSDCVEKAKPVLFRLQTEEKGHVVYTKYFTLDIPLIIRDFWQEIYPLLPTKYSAFQEDGSGNGGYLYPCHEEMTLAFSSIIRTLNKKNTEEQLSLSIDAIQMTNPLFTLLDYIDKEVKQQVLQEQSLFIERQRSLWDGQCPICHINLPKMMRATHAKPIKDSLLEERNDPYNGVFLCANHAVLYEEGLISLDGSGKLHISQQIQPEEYSRFQLTANKKITINKENKTYFRWHKRYHFHP
ncbi:MULTISPECIES: HNH endonuclease [unclassified Rummeliibacillus]|uniref:HNH endonuclease n=1 Tax=unclassified Rummeliibacillus TaxID=2622809 RepID=UPI000E674A8C|nr:MULTISPECIES: HNH endonuclease [unclassified Rummeliibacillus]RIJ64696.1 HNH endonuclease [Rummeliibacillus sp. POC4]RPJ97323.1 HNH endonuclease [Rummeliibacillus sp. TYF005]